MSNVCFFLLSNESELADSELFGVELSDGLFVLGARSTLLRLCLRFGQVENHSDALDKLNGSCSTDDALDKLKMTTV